MNLPLCALLAGCGLLAGPAAAAAGEIWFGAYAHDVKTPLTYSGVESGANLQLGWRGERMERWRSVGSPAPYVYASGNTSGATNFASAGLSWRIGDRVFFRPALGVAVHDGPSRRDPADERIWFGSRVLLAPEVGVGWQATERTSIEASWVHLSHAQLAGRQNPGLDTFGVRVTRKLR